MQFVWDYLGYNTDVDSLYKIKGSICKINNTQKILNLIISMEYENYKYSITMDYDEQLTHIFIKYYIKNIKKLINNEIDSFILDGIDNLYTEFCKIHKNNNEYYITHINDDIDKWIIKFDNNFGNKLLNIFENILQKL